MLNYHKINSQPSETKTSKFEHYLSLGSHESSVKILPVLSFSYVIMYPQTRMVINEQKLPENGYNYVIPVTNSLRINQNVMSNDCISCKPKYLQEVEKKQTGFLYLLIEGNGGQSESQIDFHVDVEVKLSQALSIRKLTFKKGNNFEINERRLIWVKFGKFNVESSGQIFG